MTGATVPYCFQLFEAKNRHILMCMPVSRMNDISLPPQYWNVLSQDDRCEFMRLKASFRQAPKVTSKDYRVVTFSKELSVVIRYLERSPENMEARCVLVGVCFVGPYVCVNTRQLKTFLGRCKSSINGSFQQLGYVALKTKAKAKACVITALPSLQNHQGILRQWTVRYVSEDMNLCFFTSFSPVGMPPIVEGDLYDERKSRTTKHVSLNVFPSSIPPQIPTPMSIPMPIATPMFPFAAPARPLETKHIEFDLGQLEDDGFDATESDYGLAIPSSMSLDSIHWDNDTDLVVHDDPIRRSNPMTRSTSAFVSINWGDGFGDE